MSSTILLFNSIKSELYLGIYAGDPIAFCMEDQDHNFSNVQTYLGNCIFAIYYHQLHKYIMFIGIFAHISRKLNSVIFTLQ